MHFSILWLIKYGSRCHYSKQTLICKSKCMSIYSMLYVSNISTSKKLNVEVALQHGAVSMLIWFFMQFFCRCSVCIRSVVNRSLKSIDEVKKIMNIHRIINTKISRKWGHFKLNISLFVESIKIII